MIKTIGSIASILGFLISIAIYYKVRQYKKLYLGKRHIEINKKRIEKILAISDNKKRCTSSVKNEIESILNLYKKLHLPIFRKQRERKIVKEIERLIVNNGDTLPAIKQNLKYLLADFESGDIWNG